MRSTTTPPTQWVGNQSAYPQVEDSLLKRRLHMYTAKYQPPHLFSLYDPPPPPPPLASRLAVSTDHRHVMCHKQEHDFAWGGPGKPFLNTPSQDFGEPCPTTKTKLATTLRWRPPCRPPPPLQAATCVGISLWEKGVGNDNVVPQIGPHFRSSSAYVDFPCLGLLHVFS